MHRCAVFRFLSVAVSRFCAVVALGAGESCGHAAHMSAIEIRMNAFVSPNTYELDVVLMLHFVLHYNSMMGTRKLGARHTCSQPVWIPRNSSRLPCKHDDNSKPSLSSCRPPGSLLRLQACAHVPLRQQRITLRQKTYRHTQALQARAQASSHDAEHGNGNYNVTDRGVYVHAPRRGRGWQTTVSPWRQGIGCRRLCLVAPSCPTRLQRGRVDIAEAK